MSLMDEISSEGLIRAAGLMLIALNIFYPVRSLWKQLNKTETEYVYLYHITWCLVHEGVSSLHISSLEFGPKRNLFQYYHYLYKYFIYPNVLGFIFAGFYFVYLSQLLPRRFRVVFNLREALIVMASSSVYLVVLYIMSDGFEVPSFLFELTGTLSAITKYAYPYFIIVHCHKRDVSALFPSFICSVYLLCSIVWVVCGPPYDSYIFITNVIGAVLSLLQLLIILKFRMESSSKSSSIHSPLLLPLLRDAM